MSIDKFLSRCVNGFFREILSVEENKSFDLGSPKDFIIIRQHNQLGDLLAGVSLFRAIKETYPQSIITLIVSPANYPGLVKNEFIDRIFVFDKKKILNPNFISGLFKLLRKEYDVAIVPVVVSISFTSNLLARISNAKTRIGPAALDGKINESSYFFDRRVVLDWRNHPDSNISERSLDIVRPFGINTRNFKSTITFELKDEDVADGFLKSIKYLGGILVGLHVGAGKVPNMWSLIKYAELIVMLSEKYNATIYLTGSDADNEAISFIKGRLKLGIGLFLNRQIPEVAALISKSDLFISNDTGIMHVAGTTSTPQITIFGPTNPFNWAPIGDNKYFIRKSELIDDVEVNDVFKLCEIILSKGKKANAV
jgi:lipopolysaccharide heptosyltransferase II